jgi:hypothetical protein
MKLVASPEEAERRFESAQREGEKYFADAASTSSATSRIHGTSRCRCSPTRTGT